MIVQALKLIISLSLVVALSACDTNPVYGKNGNFRLKDAGPDEFAVLPSKELVYPEDYATLPEPVLGATNRADVSPQRDAVAALGGKSDQLDSKQINRNELQLVASASRYGVSPDIRATLAAEDKKYSKKNRARFYERWLFNDGGYLSHRKEMSLEPYGELARLRAMGVRTPSVPAENAQ
jgi:hypothetical protein